MEFKNRELDLHIVNLLTKQRVQNEEKAALEAQVESLKKYNNHLSQKFIIGKSKENNIYFDSGVLENVKESTAIITNKEDIILELETKIKTLLIQNEVIYHEFRNKTMEYINQQNKGNIEKPIADLLQSYIKRENELLSRLQDQKLSKSDTKNTFTIHFEEKVFLM